MLSNEKLKKEIASIYRSKKFFWSYGFSQYVNSKDNVGYLLEQLKKITCSLSYHFVGIRIMLVGPNAASVKVEEDNQWKFYFLSGKYRYNKEMVCKDGAKVLSCYYFSGLEQMSQLINVVTGKVIPQNQTGENATLLHHNLTEAVAYFSVLQNFSEVESEVEPEEEANADEDYEADAEVEADDEEEAEEESKEESEPEADDEEEPEEESEEESEPEANDEVEPKARPNWYDVESDDEDDVPVVKPVVKSIVQQILEIKGNNKLTRDEQLAEIAELPLN